MGGPQSAGTVDTLEDVLAHFGVKGMHWGVRKSDTPASNDAATAKALKKKAKVGGKKSLSNEELEVLIKRMNLEQQFTKLNPPANKEAKKFVTDILQNVGKQQATKFASDVAAKQIAALLKR